MQLAGELFTANGDKPESMQSPKERKRMRIIENLTAEYRNIAWSATRSEAAKHINAMLGVARAKNLMAGSSVGSPQAYRVELTDDDESSDWSRFGCALIEHHDEHILVTPAPVARKLNFDFGNGHLAEALGYDLAALARSAAKRAFAARLKENLKPAPVARKSGATFLEDRIDWLNETICRASGISRVQGKFKRALREAMSSEKPSGGLTENFARQVFARLTGATA